MHILLKNLVFALPFLDKLHCQVLQNHGFCHLNSEVTSRYTLYSTLLYSMSPWPPY